MKDFGIMAKQVCKGGDFLFTQNAPLVERDARVIWVWNLDYFPEIFF